MAKRRSRKTRQTRFRSFVTLALIVIIGLLSVILHRNGDQGGIDGRTESGVYDLQVHYIDVGQADSILIRIPTENGMKNMLIDAGTSSGYPAKVITDYLDGLGVETISYMIVTHPHFDHNAAAQRVIENYRVEKLILPECDTSQKTWLNMLEAMEELGLGYIPSKMGDTYQIGDASFEILGPVDASKVKENDANNWSVVIRLDYGETSFLFTGDAEEKSEKAMLAAQPSSKFKCDVLKLGHHGSETSTSEAFLAAADPSLAIIPCGEGNDYGHPEQVILDRLKKASVPVLRTDLEGTIIICSDRKEVYRLTK